MKKISIASGEADHLSFVKRLADSLGRKLIDNEIVLPEQYGHGYLKVIELSNGLQVMVNEYKLKSDVFFERPAYTTRNYLLRFDEVRNVESLKIRLEDELINVNENYYSGALLMCSMQPFMYKASAGAESRSINIQLPEKWLLENSGIRELKQVLEQLKARHNDVFGFEVLNFGYRDMMQQIFDLSADKNSCPLSLKNRIMLLVERFFANILRRTVHGTVLHDADNTDIRTITRAESMLVNDFSSDPPSIAALAKASAMSETKFKSMFKKAYGLNPYEYYQQCRMLRAKYLLHMGDYTVKEVGQQLGFKNLSNFTIAFKKAFNQLPSEN